MSKPKACFVSHNGMRNVVNVNKYLREYFDHTDREGNYYDMGDLVRVDEDFVFIINYNNSYLTQYPLPIIFGNKPVDKNVDKVKIMPTNERDFVESLLTFSKLFDYVRKKNPKATIVLSPVLSVFFTSQLGFEIIADAGHYLEEDPTKGLLHSIYDVDGKIVLDNYLFKALNGCLSYPDFSKTANSGIREYVPLYRTHCDIEDRKLAKDYDEEPYEFVKNKKTPEYSAVYFKKFNVICTFDNLFDTTGAFTEDEKIKTFFENFTNKMKSIKNEQN